MSEFPFFYNRVSPTTWVHLSSLLTIAVFFKFSRLWSIRNLDLLCLIAAAPGILAVQYGHGVHDVGVEQAGYIWVFASGLLFLVRMLIDPMMVRRPLLEPNLSVGGLTFLGIALFAFLMSNVLTGKPEPEERVAQPVAAVAADQAPAREGDRAAREGPGFPLLFHIPNFITQDMTVLNPAAKAAAEKEPQPGQPAMDLLTSRLVLVCLHFAVVLGLVLIGYRHFDNAKTGIAAALVYLLLPYTAELTGHLRHVLPAAPLVWAILAYRRPVISGMFIGLAIGLSYYPLFLLPLWLSFYWQRGLLRFIGGLIPAVGILVGILALMATNQQAFIADLKQMLGWTIPQMTQGYFEGFWGLKLLDPVYRIPVLAACIALSGTMAIWPAQKNLGTLMSCSAAVMLATQFWNAHQGGLFVAWYLPLLVLTIFRPNLEDRVALSVLGDGWFSKRRPQLRIERAA
ncbi:MAG TPA: hypothetical protein VG056_12550 [Pirellulales bacterium]|jgi:hypothetical protein|nr:hypothetical protein [Pirellulales bacterium]